jgi:hypothetical protein
MRSTILRLSAIYYPPRQYYHHHHDSILNALPSPLRSFQHVYDPMLGIERFEAIDSSLPSHLALAQHVTTSIQTSWCNRNIDVLTNITNLALSQACPTTGTSDQSEDYDMSARISTVSGWFVLFEDHNLTSIATASLLSEVPSSEPQSV